MTKAPWIEPEWPVPPNVHALSTTRRGGVSNAPWSSLNLGGHVNDNPAHVSENRRRLIEHAALPDTPQWLTQVHGSAVLELSANHRQSRQPPRADAAYSASPGAICAVLTADCLPVLFADAAGREVAAAHAGWRGLAGGVLEETLAHFSAPPGELRAWLGPAIGPAVFEVGADVKTAFTAWSSACETAFVGSGEGRWLADIYELARLRLRQAGLFNIFGGGWCTFSDAERFFSFRRDGETGRMATLIWIDEPQ
jgi:polyphenol oxidase